MHGLQLPMKLRARCQTRRAAKLRGRPCICPVRRTSRTWMLRVANSTPMVDLDSSENSLRVKRDRRFDLPTPESPISTTLKR